MLQFSSPQDPCFKEFQQGFHPSDIRKFERLITAREQFLDESLILSQFTTRDKINFNKYIENEKENNNKPLKPLDFTLKEIQNLPLKELLDYARHKDTQASHENYFINECLEKHLAFLVRHHCKIIRETNESAYLTILRILREQRREVNLLLKNPKLSKKQKAALKNAFNAPLSTQKLEAVDDLLNLTNMSLVNFRVQQWCADFAISFDYLGLTRFPEALITTLSEEHPHLSYLFLNGNHFNSLPDTINKLGSLQILELKNNNALAVLPTTIRELTSLTQICVDDPNLVASFPNLQPSQPDINERLPLLGKKLVRMTFKPSESADLVLIRTFNQQQSEIALLIKNDNLTAAQKAALKKAFVEKRYIIAQLSTNDKLLNTFNVNTASPSSRLWQRSNLAAAAARVLLNSIRAVLSSTDPNAKFIDTIQQFSTQQSDFLKTKNFLISSEIIEKIYSTIYYTFLRQQIDIDFQLTHHTTPEDQKVKHLPLLHQNNVRFIRKSNEPFELTFARTFDEQQKEVASLLENNKVTHDQKGILKTISKKPFSIEQLIINDTLLNLVNRSLAEHTQPPLGLSRLPYQLMIPSSIAAAFEGFASSAPSLCEAATFNVTSIIQILQAIIEKTILVSTFFYGDMKAAVDKYHQRLLEEQSRNRFPSFTVPPLREPTPAPVAQTEKAKEEPYEVLARQMKNFLNLSQLNQPTVPVLDPATQPPVVRVFDSLREGSNTTKTPTIRTQDTYERKLSFP